MPINFRPGGIVPEGPDDVVEWATFNKADFTGEPCKLGNSCLRYSLDQDQRGEHAKIPEGRYDYSGYCGIGCREFYFRGIGGGDARELYKYKTELVDKQLPHP